MNKKLNFGIKLVFAILCEKAFFGQNNNLNIIEAFENINAKKFPAVSPAFSLVTKVKGKYKGEHVQSIIIKNLKENAIIAESKKTIKVNKDGGYAILITNFRMIKFPNKGEYSIEIKINQKKLSKLALNLEAINHAD